MEGVAEYIIRRNARASSKSLASSPSIVTILKFLISFLLLISFSSISSDIPSAKLKTFGGNSSGNPNFFIIVKMSFNLSDVTAFREAVNEDENEINSNKCVIYLKSGEYFFINTPYHTILELIDL